MSLGTQVAGRRREGPHKRRDVENLEVEKVQMYYFYANLRSETVIPGDLKHIAIYAPKYE